MNQSTKYFFVNKRRENAPNLRMDFATNEISGNQEKLWKKHASEKIEQNLCVDPTLGHPGAVLRVIWPVLGAEKRREDAPKIIFGK